MQKLDQKQKMQVVVLGLLAVGMFGTFIFRMLQVSPAAAHTQTATAAPPWHRVNVPFGRGYTSAELRLSATSRRARPGVGAGQARAARRRAVITRGEHSAGRRVIE